ncbi:MAG: uracil-DNA glycosylase family protein [Treponema sp.]|jgi:hypothetical protein|nr:uracil-DNA glycosylase family protein [Treponema sp.]
MTAGAWTAFCGVRDRYREALEQFNRDLRGLKNLQQQLVDSRSGPAYTVETALVYNQALDELDHKDEIRLILVGDNPGRREQAARRYLVGPSGKIAEGFFRRTAELGIDLRKNVLILNKTPIHTPRTVELKELCRLGGAKLSGALTGTQRFMASLLLEFHRALSPPKKARRPALPVWITGYSEMKEGGIFETYTRTLGELYAGNPLGDSVFLYRHFSMNQFSIDLRQQTREGESAGAALDRIGRSYRKRILGW